MAWEANTKLLIHCDGADESTTFTDVSGQGHTIVAQNNAQVDTAQKVFGTGSALSDGTTDWLRVNESDDFYFADGDFTVDFRLRFNSAAGCFLIGSWVSPNMQWIIYYDHNNDDFVFGYSTDGSTYSEIKRTWTASNDTWYHVAVVRDGSSLLFFIDGTQLGSSENIGSVSINNGNQYLGIMAHVDAGQYSVNGWMDEIRIVKGTAVWTSNFTPPSEMYYKYKIEGYAKLSGVGQAGINIRLINETSDTQEGEEVTDGDGFFKFYLSSNSDPYHVCMDKASIDGTDYNALSFPNITPVSS